MRLAVLMCSLLSLAAAEIVEGPASQVAAVGQTVTFNCVVNPSSSLVVWKHNTTWLNLQTAPARYSTLHNKSFVIAGCQPEDAGEWVCAGITMDDNTRVYSNKSYLRQACKSSLIFNCGIEIHHH